MLGDFDVTEQQGMDFITGGSVIIDYGQKRLKLTLDLWMPYVDRRP